jgi:pSer/pThr/pTyr-binding forkhead associated (FHA) protein
MSSERENFVSLDELRERARTGSFEEFAALCPAPILELVPADPTGQFAKKLQAKDADPQARTAKATRQTVMSEDGSGGALLYQGRAAVLAKHSGSTPSPGVSIGRALTNDIVVLLDTVSKVHGLFASEKDRWTYSDNKSTNGSVLNGVAVKAGEKRPLADGDQLRLGLELIGVFHTPRALYERFRRY